MALMILVGIGAGVFAATSGDDGGDKEAAVESDASTTITTEPVTTTEASTTTAPPTTAAAPPATVTLPQNYFDPGLVGDEYVPEPGSWVSVLSSIDATLPQDEINRQLQAAQSLDPYVGVLDSDLYPSLRPGYLVAYRGPFATAADAWLYCNQLGGDCYGAPLTYDSADQSVRIRPEDPMP